MMRPSPHPGNPTAAPPLPDPTRAYLHHARRLRARFWRDPATLHRRLQKLSQTVDAATVTTKRPPSLSADSPVAWDFARHVAHQHQLEPGLLRYSSRLKLLEHAAKLGIGRFEANLIIAVAEHRARQSAAANANPVTRTGYRRWIAPAATAIALQTALAALAYWIGLLPL